jgi:hypothetical protein
MANLRVTRQYIEVLGAGDAKARVTRQYIDVLGDAAIHDGKAIHSLSLSHLAEVEKVSGTIYEVSVTHTLTLGSVAEGSRIFPVAHTLALSHAATEVAVFGRSAIDTLVAVQEAARIAVLGQSATDGLGLTDGATLTYVLGRHAISALGMDDAATVEKIKPVVQSLSLTHLAQVDVVRQGFSTISLTNAAGVLVTYARSAVETLVLTHQATINGEFLRSTSDTLVLGQSVVGDLCKVGTHTLALTHTAEVSLVRLASNDLALSHQVDSNWVFIRRRADTLALTHAAEVAAVWAKNAVGTLSLTHEAIGIASKLVTHDLSLSHVASVDCIRWAADTLGLTHSASVTTNRLGARDDLIGLSHQAAVRFIKQVSAADTLHLTHRGRSGVEIGLASDTLQSVYYEFDLETEEWTPHYVGLQDQADRGIVHGTPYPVQSILSLSDRALGVVIHADAIACGVTDTLSLTHSNVVVQLPYFRGGQRAASSLVLTQVAGVVVAKTVSHTLVLTHAATRVMDRATLAVADTLILGQAVAFVVVSGGALHQYRPFIGEGPAGAPTPPSATCPVPISGIGQCRLVYPVDTHTDQVLLRNPELGNKDRLSFNRISRETRGGTLIVFADPIWPKTQTMALTIRDLTYAQVQEYLTFVEAHLGLEVGFVDWEGFYWKGVIMNPSEPTVQDGPGCQYTISFEFECEPATWVP